MTILDEVCKQALHEWGLRLQLIVSIEELSELQKEICKLIRLKDIDETLTWEYWNGEDLEHLVEEIADVELMLHQIKLSYNLFDDVDKIRQKKINRLIKILGVGG